MATPTPAGFARSLALDPLSDELETLQLVAEELLLRLSNRHYPGPREAAEIALDQVRAGRSVNQVAHATGFVETASFCRAFRRWTGCNFLAQNQPGLDWSTLANGDADLLSPTPRRRPGSRSAPCRHPA